MNRPFKARWTSIPINWHALASHLSQSESQLQYESYNEPSNGGYHDHVWSSRLCCKSRMENGAVRCDGPGGCSGADECKNGLHTGGRHEALCQNVASCDGPEWPGGGRQLHILCTHVSAPPERKEHIKTHSELLTLTWTDHGELLAMGNSMN